MPNCQLKLAKFSDLQHSKLHLLKTKLLRHPLQGERRICGSGDLRMSPFGMQTCGWNTDQPISLIWSHMVPESWVNSHISDPMSVLRSDIYQHPAGWCKVKYASGCNELAGIDHRSRYTTRVVYSQTLSKLGEPELRPHTTPPDCPHQYCCTLGALFDPYTSIFREIVNKVECKNNKDIAISSSSLSPFIISWHMSICLHH